MTITHGEVYLPVIVPYKSNNHTLHICKRVSLQTAKLFDFPFKFKLIAHVHKAASTHIFLFFFFHSHRRLTAARYTVLAAAVAATTIKIVCMSLVLFGRVVFKRQDCRRCIYRRSMNWAAWSWYLQFQFLSANVCWILSICWFSIYIKIERKRKKFEARK